MRIHTQREGGRAEREDLVPCFDAVCQAEAAPVTDEELARRWQQEEFLRVNGGQPAYGMGNHVNYGVSYPNLTPIVAQQNPRLQPGIGINPMQFGGIGKVSIFQMLGPRCV